MATNKKFVTIQSDITIQVTAGLQNQDVTNPDAHVPDRLKVQPLWPKLKVLIRQGQHSYPSEIATWPTVLNLQKDKLLTIGQFTDEPINGEDDARAVKTQLTMNMEEVKSSMKTSKKVVSLNEIVGDE